jgi:hypothetical protein
MDYLPFMLYRESLCKILLEEKIGKSVSIIQNLDCIVKKDEKQIVIMCIQCFNNSIHKLDFLKNLNAHILIYNTEFSKSDIGSGNLQIFNLINYEYSPFKILEYNHINYDFLKSNFPHLNINVLPLLYNEYLEEYYTNNLNTKIEWKNKSIDILFYGWVKNRREIMLQMLKEKFPTRNIVFGDKYDNKTLCNLIEQSKIVIDVAYYPESITFNYYRDSFLIANKALLVSEITHTSDHSFNSGMVNAEQNLILSKFENIPDIIGEYFMKNDDEIQEIIDKQYNWFKNNNNMKTQLLSIINNLGL